MMACSSASFESGELLPAVAHRLLAFRSQATYPSTHRSRTRVRRHRSGPRRTVRSLSRRFHSDCRFARLGRHRNHSRPSAIAWEIPGPSGSSAAAPVLRRPRYGRLNHCASLAFAHPHRDATSKISPSIHISNIKFLQNRYINQDLRRNLWATAENLRANMDAAEYKAELRANPPAAEVFWGKQHLFSCYRHCWQRL